MTSISSERAALLRAGGPRLRRREQWGAKHNYATSRPVDEPATRIVVHITVTNPRNYSSNDAHARGVEAIGRVRFPNTGISYNRLVMPDGAVYEAQPIGRRGAHTLNDKRWSACKTSGCPGRGGPLTAPSWNLNVNARAYVICQNVGDPISDRQLDSLARVIAADIRAGFVRADARIHGHRCVSAKSCPGDRMWARMGDLDRLVRRYVKPAPAPVPEREDDAMAYLTRYLPDTIKLPKGQWLPLKSRMAGSTALTDHIMTARRFPAYMTGDLVMDVAGLGRVGELSIRFVKYTDGKPSTVDVAQRTIEVGTHAGETYAQASFTVRTDSATTNNMIAVQARALVDGIVIRAGMLQAIYGPVK